MSKICDGGKPKYKIGDTLLTSRKADGWGSTDLICNRKLVVIDIIPCPGYSEGCYYTFEGVDVDGGKLTTRECEIVRCVKSVEPYPIF